MDGKVLCRDPQEMVRTNVLSLYVICDFNFFYPDGLQVSRDTDTSNVLRNAIIGYLRSFRVERGWVSTEQETNVKDLTLTLIYEK